MTLESLKREETMTCEECRGAMQRHPGVFSKGATLATLEDLLYYISPESDAGKVIVGKITRIRGSQ